MNLVRVAAAVIFALSFLSPSNAQDIHPEVGDTVIFVLEADRTEAYFIRKGQKNRMPDGMFMVEGGGEFEVKKGSVTFISKILQAQLKERQEFEYVGPCT